MERVRRRFRTVRERCKKSISDITPFILSEKKEKRKSAQTTHNRSQSEAKDDEEEDPSPHSNLSDSDSNVKPVVKKQKIAAPSDARMKNVPIVNYSSSTSGDGESTDSQDHLKGESTTEGSSSDDEKGPRVNCSKERNRDSGNHSPSAGNSSQFNPTESSSDEGKLILVILNLNILEHSSRCFR